MNLNHQNTALVVLALAAALLYPSSDGATSIRFSGHMRTILCAVFLAALTGFAINPSVASATSIVFPGHMRTLRSVETINGFEFPRGSDVEVLNSTGEPTGQVVLHQDWVVDGLRLEKGTYLRVGSKPSHLYEFHSEPGQRLNGIRLPAQTQVAFDEHGRLQMLISPEPDEGIEIQGQRYAGNRWINFYPSGRVKSGELAQGFASQGLRVQPGAIEYYANGHIKQAHISAGSVYRDFHLKPATSSEFDVVLWPHGKLHKAILADSAVVDGKACPPGYIELDQSGKLVDCSGSPYLL